MEGRFVLLVIVSCCRPSLDNIAAAMIGAAMAHTLFAQVHIGFLAVIVAASNAGGAGSVVGDTTITMTRIDACLHWVLHAYVAAVPALVISGLIAARQQHALSPILARTKHVPHIDWVRVGIVVAILTSAIAANVSLNFWMADAVGRFPILAVAVWLVIFLSAPVRRPDWELLAEASRGAVFLLSLVLAASMMPVDRLPAASWPTTFGLGFISAVFDNIPLTKLALEQGGYDWGMLAYAVGYGGSMIWFGSSAGVAVSNLFPQARSVGAWVKGGWHVSLAYVAGFVVLLALLGWNPHAPH